MGRARRPRPKRMGRKLRLIRVRLGLNLTEMAKRLEYKTIRASSVSEYEYGKREPTLPIIVKYAELAGCAADCLINDRLDLP